MARLVLHIGTHKTATTTIQNWLARHRRALGRTGFVYPDLGPITGHHGLAMQWLDLPAIFALPGGPEAAWERIARHHAASDATVILSSEEFSRGRPGPGVDFGAIRARFSDYESVEVVCALRDQLSYLQSIYLEISKKQTPPPWSAFLQDALASGFASGLFLDFNDLNARLRKYFACDEIRYVDFGAAAGSTDGMLGRFRELLGIPAMPDDGRRDGEVRANVSPPALAAWAAHQVAAPGLPTEDLIAHAAAALEREIVEAAQRAGENGRPPPSTLFSREEEARVLARFVPANARFLEGCAAAGQSLGLTPLVTPQKKFHREDLGPGFWLRIARRLHHRPCAA